jgi:3',5'-cyclic AMP phosphodiesterase CpdA
VTDLDLTIGFVTDLHFGPEARFEGKLRKLTHEAPRLVASAVEAINREDVDALVNLGDDIEDESHDADLARYRECQSILRRARAPLINVAGNHDTIHLKARELLDVWGRDGKLYTSLDVKGWHLVVLHTIERQGVDIHVDAEQVRWLRDDLARTKRPTVVLMHHSASEQELEDSRWFARAPHLALARDRAELRAIFEASGVVRAVFNGHVHRNHFDVIGGIPYVTFQSMIENLDDDAPGRAAATWALVRLSERRMVVRVRGNDAAGYQFERG